MLAAWGRHSATRVVAMLLAASAVASVPAGADGGSPSAAVRQVVITAVDGVEQAAAAVAAAGGKVLERLPLGSAVVAEVPAGATLAPGVTVVDDRVLTVASGGDVATQTSTVRETLGLAAAGNEGSGVGVALVDTGIADVPGLAGKVVARVNTSGSNAGDGYGHGTFLGGLIAGQDLGVAPGASLVDVDVADASGETSLTKVLRGLEAVADLAAEHNVRVVNLSLSSGSPLPYQLDPLARALESLWNRGIVVVVAAGNDGPDRGTISSPGNDPVLLTVGAVDEHGTSARADDTVPVWSSRGPAQFRVAKPDVAAPGASVLSLRAPGSVIDTSNPSARVGDSLFRGSGTSMSAAVVSGAVAALLERRPSLEPNAVKGTLVAAAYDAAGLADPDAAGAGGVDVAAAYTASPDAGHGRRGRGAAGAVNFLNDDAEAWEAFARAWAAGDYDAAARAWAQLSPAARAWAARAWAAEIWSRANSWSDEEFEARAWAARAWAARAWAGDEWLARAWAARAWAGADWAARAWAARAWSARAWSAEEWAARAWAARAWSARAWSARAWSDEDWAARAWSDEEWAARAWSARAWSARAWSARAWTARAWG